MLFSKQCFTSDLAHEDGPVPRKKHCLKTPVLSTTLRPLAVEDLCDSHECAAPTKTLSTKHCLALLRCFADSFITERQRGIAQKGSCLYRL